MQSRQMALEPGESFSVGAGFREITVTVLSIEENGDVRFGIEGPEDVVDALEASQTVAISMPEKPQLAKAA